MRSVVIDLNHNRSMATDLLREEDGLRMKGFRMTDSVCSARVRPEEKGMDAGMENLRLCDSEYRFMLIIWENAPVRSGELVRLCREQLGWKKSTTYTALKNLGEKGFVKNEDAVVSVLVPKEKVQAEESVFFVERIFGGSLPGFVTSFLGSKGISKEEAEYLKSLIDEHEGGNV